MYRDMTRVLLHSPRIDARCASGCSDEQRSAALRWSETESERWIMRKSTCEPTAFGGITPLFHIVIVQRPLPVSACICSEHGVFESIVSVAVLPVSRKLMTAKLLAYSFFFCSRFPLGSSILPCQGPMATNHVRWASENKSLWPGRALVGPGRERMRALERHASAQTAETLWFNNKATQTVMRGSRLGKSHLINGD